MRPAHSGWCALALLLATPATAQVPLPESAPPIYRAPGFYGTVYGVPSYGSIRTWSAYPSPFGVGYGYGYPPSAVLPGPWGNGLWSGTPGGSGIGDTGYLPAPGRYTTFPAIPVPEYPGYRPSFGYYAPSIGPPSPAPTFGR